MFKKPRIAPGQFILAVLILICLSCAKQIFPPGGPEDKTPPGIVATFPVDGQVGVTLDTRIEVFFSERIDRKSVTGAVFISPPLREEPLMKVKGDRLIIEPEMPLDSGRTYVVTLGSSTADLHRNKMVNSQAIAFSTGDFIDSSAISGKIYEKLKPKRGFRLFAFEITPGLFDSLFELTPDYITESGDSGSFQFRYIKSGTYLVLGVEDKDADNKINRYSERIALSTSLITTVHMLDPPEEHNLHITSYDSTLMEIITCSGYNGTVRIRFGGGKLDPQSLVVDSTSIISSTGMVFKPDRVMVFEHELSQVYIYSEKLELDSGFTIIISGLEDSRGRSVMFDTSGCRVHVSKPDRSPPEILSRNPESGRFLISPAESLMLAFSEPVIIGETAARIVIDSTRTISLIPVNIDGTRYTFLPDTAEAFDTIAGMMDFVLDKRLIADKYGNVPVDSLYKFRFSVANPESLGTLTGEIESDSSGEIVVKLTGLTHKLQYTFIESVGMFAWTLYPDRYTISAFADNNSNSRWDLGGLTPFGFAEPGFVVNDTVRVRARFEHSGNKFIFK